MATTPVLSDFDGLPYPRVRGVPLDFFHQNDRKGCKRDYVDARGHYILCFGAIGDKSLGGGNPSRKTRFITSKNEQNKYTLNIIFHVYINFLQF